MCGANRSHKNPLNVLKTFSDKFGSLDSSLENEKKVKKEEVGKRNETGKAEKRL